MKTSKTILNFVLLTQVKNLNLDIEFFSAVGECRVKVANILNYSESQNSRNQKLLVTRERFFLQGDPAVDFDDEAQVSFSLEAKKYFPLDGIVSVRCLSSVQLTYFISLCFQFGTRSETFADFSITMLMTSCPWLEILWICWNYRRVTIGIFRLLMNKKLHKTVLCCGLTHSMFSLKYLSTRPKFIAGQSWNFIVSDKIL